MNQGIEERFWAKVDKSAGENSCWLWTATKRPTGYGQFWNTERIEGAHRFSARLSGMHIPDGMVVCHKCDNPSCVNPRHLFVGTHKDNIEDCISKGRHSPPPKLVIKGKSVVSPRCVLTPEKVWDIKKNLNNSSIAGLARTYGVGESTIRHIAQGTTWKHIEVTQ